MAKKWIAVLIALIMVISLAACGADSSGSDDQNAADAAAEETADEASSEETGGNRVLVLYFSAGNMNDVDAVSSATPMVGDTSATGWIAEIIHEEMGGDIEGIVPSVDYPLDYDGCIDVAKKETDSGARPDFKPLTADPESYDTIFIGYPVWWYTIPMVLETFFDQYDLSGKTIVPFNTHAGSRDGGTYTTIQEREPDAVVLEGLAVSGSSAGSDDARTEITEWIKGLDLN